MKNLSFAVIFLALSLTGCGKDDTKPTTNNSTPAQTSSAPSDKAQVNSLDWYKANPEKAAEEIAKCNKLPAQEAFQNANCITANRAKSSINWESTKGIIKPKPLTAEDLKLK